jgi:hypothetical protein
MENAKLELEYIKTLIEILDSYRSNNFVDISVIDKMLENENFSQKRIETWQEVKKNLISMAKSVREVKNLPSFLKFYSFIRAIYPVFGAIFILNMLLIAAGLRLEYLSILTVIIFIILVFAEKILERKMSIEIQKYFMEHPKLFFKQRLQLKKLVQSHINEIIKIVRGSKMKIKKSKLTLELFNIDYDKIEVIKNPSKIRKRYKVRLQLTENSS